MSAMTRASGPDRIARGARRRQSIGTAALRNASRAVALSPLSVSLYWSSGREAVSVAPFQSATDMTLHRIRHSALSVVFCEREAAEFAGLFKVAPLKKNEIKSMAEDESARNEIVSYQRILTAQQDRMLRHQDRVDANQSRLDKMLEKILTNQATIVANQQRIRDNQTKLDKIVTNQGIIVANQQGILVNLEKLDRLLSNQATTIG